MLLREEGQQGRMGRQGPPATSTARSARSSAIRWATSCAPERDGGRRQPALRRTGAQADLPAGWPRRRWAAAMPPTLMNGPLAAQLEMIPKPLAEKPYFLILSRQMVERWPSSRRRSGPPSNKCATAAPTAAGAGGERQAALMRNMLNLLQETRIGAMARWRARLRDTWRRHPVAAGRQHLPGGGAVHGGLHHLCVMRTLRAEAGTEPAAALRTHRHGAVAGAGAAAVRHQQRGHPSVVDASGAARPKC
jgi:hypothetical protein